MDGVHQYLLILIAQARHLNKAFSSLGNSDDESSKAFA